MEVGRSGLLHGHCDDRHDCTGRNRYARFVHCSNIEAGKENGSLLTQVDPVHGYFAFESREMTGSVEVCSH